MSLITLPGLIDAHVHLRDPGQTEKEDFYTGTCAALSGGFTTILDMPNNKTPITTAENLDEKIKIAKEKIVCDVGFYFGSMGDNLDEFQKVQGKVKGLKLYLNETTGNFLIDKNILEKTFLAWLQRIKTKDQRPILVHAEEKMVENVLNIVKKTGAPTHFCHISLAKELKLIVNAKNERLPITCGVTPHHLFLNDNDVNILGPFGQMKPPLSSKKDQDYLWKNLSYIDVIESDHAPHTIEEKVGEGWRQRKGSRQRARVIPKEYIAEHWREGTGDRTPSKEQAAGPAIPQFGVPGLETTLPLLLTAVSEKRLTIEDILRLCHKNPAKIFGIKYFDDSNHRSEIEVDLSENYIIQNKNLFTKCKWTPFDGWRVKGKVKKVYIRGKKVFENGKILVEPGFGTIL